MASRGAELLMVQADRIWTSNVIHSKPLRRFQIVPNLSRPGERLTEWCFKEAPLDALLDVSESLSQDSY